MNDPKIVDIRAARLAREINARGCVPLPSGVDEVLPHHVVICDDPDMAKTGPMNLSEALKALPSPKPKTWRDYPSRLELNQE